MQKTKCKCGNPLTPQQIQSTNKADKYCSRKCLRETLAFIEALLELGKDQPVDAEGNVTITTTLPELYKKQQDKQVKFLFNDNH